MLTQLHYESVSIVKIQVLDILYLNSLFHTIGNFYLRTQEV